MIGSFNYGDGSTTYNLTVTMNGGNGNGANAVLGQTLGGKPKSGTINMGRGSNGQGSGWFIDPTPNEHSEFMGNITNAFSGDAQAGSPASGLGDFFTVAAAEITHVLGLYGSSLPLWSSKTTNTGIADTAEGGGRGTFYVFRGPSIKHLLTSNNGGPGGSSFGSAVHGAGPGVPVNFQGDTYIGAQDIGNAVYEFSRRYIPGNTFALMFKDAFSYSTQDPAKFGTFYSTLSNSQVLVRGGSGGSADKITISTSGSTLTVSVDVGNDVAGTGALPGNGDLPAFVTEYDLSQLTSLVIRPGDGNDLVDIQSLPAAVALTVQTGSGDDTIKLGGGDVAANIGQAATWTINAEGGNDSILFDDSNSSGDIEYTIDGSTFSMTGLTPIDVSTFGAEGIGVLANGGNNAIDVRAVTFGTSASISAGGGSDTITLGTGNLGLLAGTLTIDGQDGTDTITLDDSAATFGQTYAITSTTVTRPGFVLNYSNLESMSLLADPLNSAITVNSTAAGMTLSIDAGPGTDLINVNETDPTSIVIIANSTNADQVTVNDGSGSAGVRFDSASTRLSSLTINGGGSAALGVGGKVLVTGNLVVNGNGVLDVNDGYLIWDYSGASPQGTLKALLTSGYAAGAWNGAGINSSDAAADGSGKTALGYAEATDLFSTFPALFAGEQVDNTSLLVRRTIYGDTNLDGTVNLSDFNRLASGFGQTGGWTQGNLNYDSTVNLSDFNLLATNFGLSVTDDTLTANLAPAGASGSAASVDTRTTTTTKRRDTGRTD
jgi:hypothetical protein